MEYLSKLNNVNVILLDRVGDATPDLLTHSEDAMSDVSDHINITTPIISDEAHQLTRQNADLVHQLEVAHTTIRAAEHKLTKLNVITERLDASLLQVTSALANSIEFTGTIVTDITDIRSNESFHTLVNLEQNIQVWRNLKKNMLTSAKRARKLLQITLNNYPRTGARVFKHEENRTMLNMTIDWLGHPTVTEEEDILTRESAQEILALIQADMAVAVKESERLENKLAKFKRPHH